jgi:dipeptidyl aminopeptidase/acylaminoacyl peptidase
MIHRRPLIAGIVACLFWASASSAQGTKADYQRSGGLYWSVFGTVAHNRVCPHWTADGNAFWYVDIEPDWGRTYWWVDAVKGTREPAFDHGRLAAALARPGVIKCDPRYLPVVDIDRDANGNIVVVVFSARYIVDPRTYTISSCELDDKPIHRLPKLDVTPARGSLGDGDRALVRFFNQTARPVRFRELESDGQAPPPWLVNGYKDLMTLQHTYAGQVFVATDEQGKDIGAYRVDGDGGDIVIEPPLKTGPTTGPSTQPADEAGQSPDGKYVAFVKDHDLWLRDSHNGNERPLTRGGSVGDGYDGYGISWSPDSKKLVAFHTAGRMDRVRNLVQASPPGDVHPKLESEWYPTPGDPLPKYFPHLFDVAGRRELPITGIDIADPIYPGEAKWHEDSSVFYFQCYQRGYQSAKVFAVDADTGHARTIVNETTRTFIDGTHPYFCFFYRNSDLIWMSEQGGWNHLWRYDTINGRVVNEITRGPWIVEPWDNQSDVIGDDMTIYFRAGGLDPAQDPYYVHYCKINPDGTGLTDFTPGDGTHSVQDSPDGRFYIDTYSRVDMPPVIELRSYIDDGGLVCPLEKADASGLLKTGWRYPERFVAKGRDGITDIYGVIYRPTNFDPTRKYPVLEDIYPGPTQASVPKAFTRWNYPMTVAELGFIVVQIDGMGTPGRSKAFHDVCWHNLGDCGFPDRIPWIKAAAAKHPEMDLSRVGIYGGSAGGYAALRALETHGDFYKVAVSQDGNHEFQLGSSGWTEQWMGYPVGPWYERQSNVTGASRMKGSLMLIVDEMDHSVDPSSTSKVVDELEKSDKDFELVMIPGGDHCSGGDYVDRRRKDFLVRHLLGVEPRAK